MSITEEDIQILIDQTGIDKELAKNILQHNRGDLVESIIQIQTNEIPDFEKEKEYQYKEENDIEEDRHLVDTNVKENLEEYRYIVDQKDIIYNLMNSYKPSNLFVRGPMSIGESDRHGRIGEKIW